MATIQELIHQKDFEALNKALRDQPSLTNEGISLDGNNTTLAHPLHRLCDGVFHGHLTHEESVRIAKLLLDHGANINGNAPIDKQDSPLTAACSLYADELALYYIEHGADIHHRGFHGGTALHWAAWCGRAKIVSKLIEAGAHVNHRCIDFQATPLFWAVRSIKNNVHKDVRVITLLRQAGADKSIPNVEGKIVTDLLSNGDADLRQALG